MIENLINGFKKFKNKNYDIKNSEVIKRAKLGQKPEFMMISCSDSRVDPSILFQSKIGKIFSVWNDANIVPPYNPKSDNYSVGAALEFGILDLNIKNIIILGHSNSGGIAALKNKLENNSSSKIIDSLGSKWHIERIDLSEQILHCLMPVFTNFNGFKGFFLILMNLKWFYIHLNDFLWF